MLPISKFVDGISYKTNVFLILFHIKEINRYNFLWKTSVTAKGTQDKSYYTCISIIFSMRI